MDPSSETAGAHTRTGKLVRDRIPEIIRAQGGHPVSATLDGAAFARALRRKLVEEAGEVAGAGDATLLDELADVYEVVVTIARRAGITGEDIVHHAAGKRVARGGFERRLWLSASESAHSGERMDRAPEPTPS